MDFRDSKYYLERRQNNIPANNSRLGQANLWERENKETLSVSYGQIFLVSQESGVTADGGLLYMIVVCNCVIIFCV